MTTVGRGIDWTGSRVTLFFVLVVGRFMRDRYTPDDAEGWTYDVSDPSTPRRADSLSVGDSREVQGRKLATEPQMLQRSLDGERLNRAAPLFSSWNEERYPADGERRSMIFEADVDPRADTLERDEDFLVDWGECPAGSAHAHEIRWSDGDCTSDVWQ